LLNPVYFFLGLRDCLIGSRLSRRVLILDFTLCPLSYVLDSSYHLPPRSYYPPSQPNPCECRSFRARSGFALFPWSGNLFSYPSNYNVNLTSFRTRIKPKPSDFGRKKPPFTLLSKIHKRSQFLTQRLPPSKVIVDKVDA